MGAEELDGFGRSRLHYAARDADLPSVELLIESGFDIVRADGSGWTPLHFAAQANSSSVVERLIRAGAAVDPSDSYGNTPLSRATFASKGNGDVIASLRAAGANPLIENFSGVSPIGLARIIANFDVAQFYADLP